MMKSRVCEWGGCVSSLRIGLLCSVTRRIEQHAYAAVLVEAKKPGRRRLTLDSQRRILNGIEIGNRVLLYRSCNALLEKLKERARDEVCLDVYACLLLQNRIILSQVLCDSGRPCWQIAGQETRAPSSPVQ